MGIECAIGLYRGDKKSPERRLGLRAVAHQRMRSQAIEAIVPAIGQSRDLAHLRARCPDLPRSYCSLRSSRFKISRSRCALSMSLAVSCLSSGKAASV